MSLFRALSAPIANIGRGILMGAADAVPGVSGGTVALILGIYVRLVTAISHFDLQLLRHLRHGRWVEAARHVDLPLLAPLGMGILSGAVALASIMNFLLIEHRCLTLAAFFGLIVASSILVGRTLERWSVNTIAMAVVGAVVAYWLVGLPLLEGSHTYLYLFICGMIAICAMILPGISGAFLLLILGEYTFVTGVIRAMKHGDITANRLLCLAAFVAGCAVGLIGFSKILRRVLDRYKTPTLAVLCGFMVGSLRRIWPFKIPIGSSEDMATARFENVWPGSFDGEVVAAVILAVVSLVLVLGLDWISRRSKSTKL